jgi:hypothetical protein
MIAVTRSGGTHRVLMADSKRDTAVEAVIGVWLHCQPQRFVPAADVRIYASWRAPLSCAICRQREPHVDRRQLALGFGS